MPLSLKIPALEEKPLIPAETRPPKIQQFIENLPQSNPLEAASELLEEMEILNRQKIAPDTRIKALELYRPVLIEIVAKLAIEYGKATLPLPESEKKHAAAAESLWLELGYGYKLALVDQQNKLFSVGGKSTAFVIQRAMESMQKLAMVYYQTYFTAPGSVWADLHQLYYYAAQQSLQDMDIPAGTKEDASISISLTYKQALMMAIADTRHLPPHDIMLVADYASRFAQHTKLQGLGLLENPAGIFLISLNTDKPPIPYIKTSKLVDARNDILFITIDLARLAHHHVQQLQAGESISSIGLPYTAGDPHYLDVLIYLIKHLGASPKRIYSRSRKSDGVAVGIGMAAAHYFVNNEQPYVPPSNLDQGLSKELEAEPGLAASKRSISASRWQVMNISAGGMALRKMMNTVEGNLRVGELLSVKDQNALHWSIGVLRWANNNDMQQLEIGAQLIAPEAKAANARWLDEEGEFEPVLLLPELPALKEAPSVIAGPGFFSPARVVELDESGRITRIMLTKLIERTASFERFNFSLF